MGRLAWQWLGTSLLGPAHLLPVFPISLVLTFHISLMGTNLPPLCLMRYRGTQKFPDLWLKKKNQDLASIFKHSGQKLALIPASVLGHLVWLFTCCLTQRLSLGAWGGASPNALRTLNLRCGLNPVSARRRGPLGLRGISCLPEGHFLSNWHRGLIFPSHPVLRMDPEALDWFAIASCLSYG